MLSDLPLCFDEVGAGDRDASSKRIYMLINGSGKARGNRGMQLRLTLSWRTVALSTGEADLASEDTTTGAQVRILQFRVSRFGSLDARGVDEVREACARNSGHVGRKWVGELLAIEEWKPYRELFDEAKRQFREKSAGGSLEHRQSEYFALLAVAEHIASQTLGIGKKGGATVRELFLDRSKRREVRSAVDRALDTINEWIASEGASFPQLRPDSNGKLVASMPVGGRNLLGAKHADYIAFLPGAFREHLNEAGYSPDEIIGALAERGALDSDSGRTTKKIRWNGERQRVIAIKRAALDRSDGTDGPDAMEGGADDFSD